jgi:hypothetical protein
MDHILPTALGGSNDSDNLAAACYRCNEYKGVRTVARDPETQQIVPIFNPRGQNWDEHLTWGNGGTHIIGLTAIGRASDCPTSQQ